MLHTHCICFDTAPNSQGPIAIVRKLGLGDNVELVDAFGKTRTEEFMAFNPCHCCPTIQMDDGDAIWESNTVMRYLCDTAPNAKGDSLYPKDPLKRAKIDMALDWRQCNLYPCFPAIGYILFGFEQDTEEAKEKFALLLDHLKTLTDVFLKDKPFIFSDTPTIADLAVALPLVFVMARSKFWAKVPDKVKEYHQRVIDAFPEAKESFDMTEGMATSCKVNGYDAEP